MEEGSSKRGIRYYLDLIPSWLQLVIGISGLVFTLGTCYSELKSNTVRIEKVEEAQLQQVAMASEISSLHVQIENSNKVQEQTNQTLVKLTDSVNDLSVSVGRLQGAVGEIPPAIKKKK